MSVRFHHSLVVLSSFLLFTTHVHTHNHICTEVKHYVTRKSCHLSLVRCELSWNTANTFKPAISETTLTTHQEKGWPFARFQPSMADPDGKAQKL